MAATRDAAADGSGPQQGLRVVGLVDGGAWAQLAAIPTGRLAAIPCAVSDAQAATLPVAGLLALAPGASAATFTVDSLSNSDMMRVVIKLALLAEQSPPADCKNDVPVRVQRRKDRRWVTVGRGRTNRRARFTLDKVQAGPVSPVH